MGRPSVWLKVLITKVACYKFWHSLLWSVYPVRLQPSYFVCENKHENLFSSIIKFILISTWHFNNMFVDVATGLEYAWNGVCVASYIHTLLTEFSQIAIIWFRTTAPSAGACPVVRGIYQVQSLHLFILLMDYTLKVIDRKIELIRRYILVNNVTSP